MFRATLAALALLALAFIAILTFTPAHAETLLPATPSTGWCGTLAGSVWNGVEACALTPPPPPVGGPANWLKRGNVQYPSSMAQLNNLDLTAWQSLWGRFSTVSPTPALAWPGISGTAPAVTNFQRTSCLATAFVVAAPVVKRVGNQGSVYEYVPNGFELSTYSGEPDLTEAYSVNPCDFAERLGGQPACSVSRPSPANTLVTWGYGSVPPAPPRSGMCSFLGYVGRTIYRNVKFTNPAQITGACPRADVPTCRIQLQQQLN